MREDKVKPSFFQYFILFSLWRLGNGPRKIFPDINGNENTKIFFTISNTLGIAKTYPVLAAKIFFNFSRTFERSFQVDQIFNLHNFFPTGPIFVYRLYPFSPEPPRQRLGTSMPLTLYRRCGLTNHMMGKVSWDLKRRRSWDS
jgi:hypothetical protein